MELEEVVRRRLGAELGRRGLLLEAPALAAAERETARLGSELLVQALRECYGEGAAVEFESEHTAARLGAALAFGATAARVLAHDVAASTELLCSVFNLGIGLVDSLCDEDAETGAALLALLAAQDPAAAAVERRERGRLRATVPPELADDPTVAFTIEIVEVFFELLHDGYPGRPWSELRREVGAGLGAALEAERRSVGRERGRDVESSRLTSVLPFRIVALLAGGDADAATDLGEAMWRIDDLVDLSDDARSGALNSLLAGTTLEELTRSSAVEAAVVEAADRLSAGLRESEDHARDAFLAFIHHYAQLPPPT